MIGDEHAGRDQDVFSDRYLDRYVQLGVTPEETVFAD